MNALVVRRLQQFPILHMEDAGGVNVTPVLYKSSICCCLHCRQWVMLPTLSEGVSHCFLSLGNAHNEEVVLI